MVENRAGMIQWDLVPENHSISGWGDFESWDLKNEKLIILTEIAYLKATESFRGLIEGLWYEKLTFA